MGSLGQGSSLASQKPLSQMRMRGQNFLPQDALIPCAVDLAFC